MASKLTFTGVFLLLGASTAFGLSWPLCESGGSVWVTKRPTTGPEFPGADLWFFCEEGINILGRGVDVCFNNGTECTPQVADAICNLIGYDEAYAEEFTSEPASLNETVVSLTGEYCLRKGVYSNKAPSLEELASMPGEPCEKISSITCSRTVDTMEAAIALGIDNREDLAVQAAPAAESVEETVDLARENAINAGQVAGRRLRFY